jgi:hypothetical protein
VTPDVRQLPSNYQAVIEWARISYADSLSLSILILMLYRSLASTVFHQFVASDDASESFSSLKRIHGMMPYFMMKTALKISNPVGMIRSMCPCLPIQTLNSVSDDQLCWIYFWLNCLVGRVCYNGL